MNAAEFQEELQGMRDDESWPRWPILPVKRYVDEGLPEVGVMIAVPGKRTNVYLINLWELESGPILRVLEDVEFHEYPDYEAIIDAGWVGD